MIIGGHLDSVPNGGWLDGILNVLAGLEVLRAQAPESRPLTLKLVSWADEEGARFGRSLLGSSAAAGSLEPDSVRGLTDRDGDGAARRAARARRRPRLGPRRALPARGRRRLPGAAHRAGARCSSRSTSRSAPCWAPSASSATPCASPACTPTRARPRWRCAATPSWPPRAARWPSARTRCAATTCAPRPGSCKVSPGIVTAVQRQLRAVARPARAGRRRARRHARDGARRRASASRPRRAAR